uniref:Centromere protein X n=1 Tax=Cyprinodon variegatus TaxID=28743 RepID=A0A3Q2CUP5_CYPVA
MADKEEEVSFKKQTVTKLLCSFFKEDKTKLSSDATLLMMDMLRIFVQGNNFSSLHYMMSCCAYIKLRSNKSICIFFSLSQEAALRSLKQAESEDCNQVELEHFEKILPQLLLDF